MTVTQQSKTKQYQLKIYLSGDAVEADAQSALLKQAAKRARRSVSNFILTAALDAAEQTLSTEGRLE